MCGVYRFLPGFRSIFDGRSSEEGFMGIVYVAIAVVCLMFAALSLLSIRSER